MIKISVDAMGGDHGVKVSVPAALQAISEFPNLHLILVGDENILTKKLRSHARHPRITIHHASEVVLMDDLPSYALRSKKDSSMRVALNLVKSGEADACVSAGNTGALMATARFVLKMLPGVDRPAIIGSIPSGNRFGQIRMLDLGANLSASTEQLIHFALMGSVISQSVDGVIAPRVALLNVGSEEMKGHETIQEAAKFLIENEVVNYVGFAEGNDIFNDTADVIVCDGFVGNVALKTSEGLARFVRDTLRESFRQSWITKLLGLLVMPVLFHLKKRINPARYNGASLVGLKGSVIKSHGNTTTYGFMKAIERAMLEVEHKVPEMIGDRVQRVCPK